MDKAGQANCTLGIMKNRAKFNRLKIGQAKTV